MKTTPPTPSIVVVKTLTVTWDEDRGGEGRLYARCDEDRTLSSDTVRWDEPITVQTDAWEIAFAVTEINGAEILSVDHDGDTVYVSVDGSVCEIDDNDDRDDGPFEIGPERLPDGRINQRRAAALEKHARFVYEYDRD